MNDILWEARNISVKINICDRYGKQYRNPLPTQQAKLPSYHVLRRNGCPGFEIVEIDLCNECQDDLANWIQGDAEKDIVE